MNEDGESIRIEIAIDRRMTSIIVAELRKLGMLTGGNQKIKIGRAPGGKKRQNQ